MTPFHSLRRFAPLFALLLLANNGCAQVQPAQTDYQPRPFQEGKDVVWLPTPQPVVEKMLEIAKVTPKDFVIDLGSGDGRTVITAAKKFGAGAMGIEYNPDMVELSNRAAAKEGIAGKVKFMKADLFETDFSRASVITMYLLPALNVKLRPKILDLKPGTRIVSHAFDMGEWQADRIESDEGRSVYLWIVPAKVAGTWRSPQGELVLTQQFQKIEGTLKAGERKLTISKGQLRGDQISISAGGTEYTGRVNGSTIEGTMTGARAGRWSASLVSTVTPR